MESSDTASDEEVEHQNHVSEIDSNYDSDYDDGEVLLNVSKVVQSICA